MPKTLHIHLASQNHLSCSFSLSIFLHIIQELIDNLFDIQICRIDNDGIIGWSQRPDGSVFIEAEAEEDSLDSFILWCEKGPVSARVDNVDITPGVVKSYKGFGIKH